MHYPKPLIVQSDRTILLEVDNPLYEEARDSILQFTELIKSPEHIQTYIITPLSLWNCAASGMKSDLVLSLLEKYSRFTLPPAIIYEVQESMGRYGKIQLYSHEDKEGYYLFSEDPLIITEICSQKNILPYVENRIDPNRIEVKGFYRGHVKQALIKIGYPVEDLGGYIEGKPLSFSLMNQTRDGSPFALREYQIEAVERFWLNGTIRGGSGVLVLPCGAGKTIIGIAAMQLANCHTLILSANIVAVRQWIDELLDKTSLDPELVGEYTGERKQLRPITVSTYQILTYRPNKNGPFPHFDMFLKQNWGLVVYDEVHLLPAPVFRITSELQTTRRLGLTATLVREDHREDDVFSLIGAKKYDVPWKELEAKGFIAQAECIEIKVEMDHALRLEYAVAGTKRKYRIASENPGKINALFTILEKHPHASVLVIGQYIDQLKKIAKVLNAPLIYGSTKPDERQRIYTSFKTGKIKILVVSKVANFAIDLPDANLAIQVSGTFGSRQEEAQRLGRILRPKKDQRTAYFYSVVSKSTSEEEFSKKRQLFLSEQGYKYFIQNLDTFQAESFS